MWHKDRCILTCSSKKKFIWVNIQEFWKKQANKLDAEDSHDLFRNKEETQRNVKGTYAYFREDTPFDFFLIDSKGVPLSQINCFCQSGFFILLFFASLRMSGTLLPFQLCCFWVMTSHAQRKCWKSPSLSFFSQCHPHNSTYAEFL